MFSARASLIYARYAEIKTVILRKLVRTLPSIRWIRSLIPITCIPVESYFIAVPVVCVTRTPMTPCWHGPRPRKHARPGTTDERAETVQTTLAISVVLQDS